MTGEFEDRRKRVAHDVRKLAYFWQTNGVPDVLTATHDLMVALGVIMLPTCEALQQIADYIDPEGDDVFGGGCERWDL